LGTTLQNLEEWSEACHYAMREGYSSDGYYLSQKEDGTVYIYSY
jgi:hypothetical protein